MPPDQREREMRDEIARLRQGQKENAELRERMAQLLTGVANALKGEPGPLVMHGWSDLPAIAAAVVAERDAAVGRLGAVP